MKIAIISDIHGNLEALKRVFEDIEARGIDNIYCLGDIVAKGNRQQECFELIKEKCEVIIKGNCDDYFINDLDMAKKTEAEINRYNWNNSKINKEAAEFISKLPFSYEFYLSGRLVRLVHAHPKSLDAFVGNIDSLENLYNLVLPSIYTESDNKADILIYGHIHTPFIQKIYNRYIINTGSVGNALDVFRNDEKDANKAFTAVANYLILSGNLDSRDINDQISFEIVSIPYNIEEELNNSKDNIEFDAYAEELRSGIYRDIEKITKTFEERGINLDDI